MEQTRFPLKYKQKLKIQSSISRLEEKIQIEEQSLAVQKKHLATMQDWLENGLPLDNMDKFIG